MSHRYHYRHASYILSDFIGREFSVFQQGVRTYRPNFNPERDEPFNHPLGLPVRIKTWNDEGPEAYEKFLQMRILQDSISRSDLDKHLPSLTTVRQIAAKRKMDAAIASGKSDSEMLKMAMEENTRLLKEMSKQRTDYESIIDIAEEDKAQYEKIADEAKAREFR